MFHPRQDVARGVLYFWLCRIVDGFVLGVFRSPPCETWSIAQYMRLVSWQSGPPPFRFADEPFGLLGLTLCQCRQFEICSLWLFSSFAMITCNARAPCLSRQKHVGPSRLYLEAALASSFPPASWRRSQARHPRRVWHVGCRANISRCLENAYV